ncbi:pheophorbidase isoform X3 [Physcomitrium patens]|uniref:pheophorbidase isoform X3 n=1 Tax=Physcomitrium patens TaxID=3218 RepID=UPI000D15FEBB|nr:pheophorbidase-like isoform X2 [Physcomitrium patens]|eukprot:XP_024356983.1 pheophorbidase-like isoform X2 [Physcomitrella patens]
MATLRQKQQYFVFVHGAQHGAWCWFKTIELLEQAGHLTKAVDLVSAGDSSVNADDVECFDHYNQPLYEVLESLGTNQKVILVCHSMGGTTVARACERYPLRIHVAVYIAGAMLKSGMSQSENHDEVFRETSKDAQFHFGKGEQNPPTSCWPSLEIVTKAYYNLCSSEDIQFAAKRLGGVPIMCDDATIFTANYHSVPRVYIRTSFDKAIAPHFQDRSNYGAFWNHQRTTRNHKN